QRQPVEEAVADAGEIEGGPWDLLEAEEARVELAGLGDVGNGDAHVVQLLEESHGNLPARCEMWQHRSTDGCASRPHGQGGRRTAYRARPPLAARSLVEPDQDGHRRRRAR